MKKVWLNKILKSQEKFGIVMVINTIILIIAMAMASGERPLFLYKEAEGQIEKISTEYVSYHRKTTISFYSTVIYYTDLKKSDKLILGYVSKDYDLSSAKQLEARYYTVKGIKKIKQLFIDGHAVRVYDKKVGVTVWIVGVISLIIEILIVRHYMRTWTLNQNQKE